MALIGRDSALARGLRPKYAIKQADRMPFSQGIDVDALLHHGVPYGAGKRPSITVVVDWTEFDDDGEARTAAEWLGKGGRALRGAAVTAVVLLTLLGAAGEALGYDRHHKSNPTTRRAHALFRRGCMLCELIPTMPEHRLQPRIERFAEMLVA